MQKSFLKIILPAILSILLFILTIFLIIIPRYQKNIMIGKREMIKELTNSAWSILAKYENDQRDGLLTREEAQKTAGSRIEYLRYGEENKDYFWITDMTPVMIMHPFRNDLNGKDLTNFTDPHGKKLFVEFVETVKKSEHGYVDYMWQWKDDSLRIVPKLSYVKVFKPWGWVIGKLSGDVKIVKPGDKITVNGIDIEVVPSYNINKQFHTKDRNWVGYIFTVNGQRIYIAGDTDHIPEMKTFKADIALLPVSGTYVMTAEEAVIAALDIKPKVAIPMHYNSIVGTEKDAKRFEEGLKGKVEVVILKEE